ncbi:MAG: hypothetical protein J7K33_07055 [Candidatus Marinimicrobia bacterium]|nr:hypothetical protein [Candidatus Neomarinimicrobiota bacterium]
MIAAVLSKKRTVSSSIYPLIRNLVFYGLLVWPFIWGNADQAWHTGQVIHIPKNILMSSEA